MMTKRFPAPQQSTAPRSTYHETKGEAKALEMSSGGAECKGSRFFVDLLAVHFLLAMTLAVVEPQPRRVEM